ncbi:MAG: DUF885 family protein [Pseudomonadota bacterium]
MPSNQQPHDQSRRDLLIAAMAGAVACVLPGAAFAGASVPGAADARLAALLATFAEEILLLAPMSATSLGLDTGKRVALKSRLDDASPAGKSKWAGQVKSMMGRLDALDRASLGEDAQIRYDAVRYAVNAGIAGLAFSYAGAAAGFYGRTVPYALSQLDGAVLRIPELLDAQHRIENGADAEAYLARVAALTRSIDEETATFMEQAGRGMVPPDFIARTALAQFENFRKTPVRAQKLFTSLVGRTGKLGIAGDWEGRAGKLIETSVYPALERQIAAFAKATSKAGEAAGIDRLSDGRAYYEWALKLGTTTTRGASEIHAIGLEQNAMLAARIDAVLKKQGMSEGTVGARLQALVKDPQRFFADDDRGREQLIAYCNERVAAARALMPKISHLGLAAPLVIKRVPPDIEAGAALGYMNFASLDGSRPAIYYINLKSTKLWPKDELATLTAHEGMPGHAWQGAYLAEHHQDIPLISSLMGFNAFIEGWALYAEQLVDEFGLYVSDPFSEIAYLQSLQFRACRLVVDTGLHAMQWSRQKAIDFLLANTGRGVAAMTNEIDRYVVWPGQACGYKMGHNEILRQRERAMAELGAKFDLAGFNDAIVQSAGVPLTVLPTVIGRYIARRRA